MSRLERTAYFCLIALCLLSGGVLIRNQWFQKPLIVQPKPESKSLIGKQLNVPGANWSRSGTSAVLFLSNSIIRRQAL